MELYVDNQSQYLEIPANLTIEKWVNSTLLHVTDTYDELGIRIVDVEESAKLNESYRNKPGATNILSFPCDNDLDVDIRILGDLAICAAIVKNEANEQNKTFDDHFAHMIVHGVLHLLGYDHIDNTEAEEMEQLEVKILKSFNIENPYLTNEVISS